MIEPIITYFSGARLAVIEHRDNPSHFPQSVDKLMSWAKLNQLGQPKAGQVFVIAYDDPKTTAPEVFRCDLGRVISAEMELGANMDVVEKFLPRGRVAIMQHQGSHDTIEQTIYGMYQNWLSTSDEELIDFPCVFCYQNFVTEVPESALKTDIYFFLKG